MKILSVIEEDALDAYIYGYPLVLMETTQKNMLAGGLIHNQFLNESSFPGPKTNTVVRPNVDTLYTTAWLDLSRGPVVLHCPDTRGKYYIMALLDAWTNVFASIGSRTTGTVEQNYIVAGPGWNGTYPPNLTRIDAPTNTVWVIGRIQTNGPEDYPVVNELQKGFLLAPLEYWRKYGFFGLSDVTARQPVLKRTAPMDQVEAMDAATFFSVMVAAMAANPPALPDFVMDQKLSALGLTGGASFDFAKLPPSVQLALHAAVKSGPEAIQSQGQTDYQDSQSGGWSVLLNDIGIYGRNYLPRAVAAMFVLGANVPADSVYGFSYLDENGQPLRGSRRYRIHFDQGQFPPANAFWSITLYDAEGFLTENPINRYAISPHLQNLNYNSDGSLDIIIQNDPPSKALAANWLPSPKGPFNLTLRLYWPRQEVLVGQWQPPPVLRA